MFVSNLVTSLFVYFFCDVSERCHGQCKQSADISELSNSKFYILSRIILSKIILISDHSYSHFRGTFFYHFMYIVRYFRFMQCFYATTCVIFFVFEMAAMSACIRTSVSILNCLLSASRALFCRQCTIYHLFSKTLVNRF